MAKTKEKEKDPAIKAAKKAAKKTGTIHLMILMDESGSMMGLEEAVVTGCNEFLHSFKDNDDCKAWIAMFDAHPGNDRTRFKIKGKKIADAKELAIEDYNPRGMTPLNDAILDSLTALDKKVGKDETVFMAIITDGYENASEASAQTVKDTIAKYEERGWGFVYLGANQNAEAASASIGLGKKGQAFNFNATKGGVTSTSRFAGAAAATHTENYVSGLRGQALASATTDWSAGEYDKTGGKLEDADEDGS